MSRPSDSPVELSEPLRALTEAARRDGPSAAQLDRLAARLGPLLPPTTPPAPPAPSAPPAPPVPPVGPATAISGVLSPAAMLVGTAIGLVAVGGLSLVTSPRVNTPAQVTSATTSSRPSPVVAPEPISPTAPALSSAEADLVSLSLPALPRPGSSSARSINPTGDGDSPSGARGPAAANGDTTSLSGAREAPVARAEVATPVASDSAATPGPSGSAANASGAAPGASASTPLDEVVLIGRAQQALATSPATALALVSDHTRAFPRSSFTQEREAITILAIARLGRTAEAELLARQFRQRYPRSAYLPRFEALLPGLQRPE